MICGSWAAVSQRTSEMERVTFLIGSSKLSKLSKLWAVHGVHSLQSRQTSGFSSLLYGGRFSSWRLWDPVFSRQPCVSWIPSLSLLPDLSLEALSFPATPWQPFQLLAAYSLSQPVLATLITAVPAVPATLTEQTAYLLRTSLTAFSRTLGSHSSAWPHSCLLRTLPLSTLCFFAPIY